MESLIINKKELIVRDLRIDDAAGCDKDTLIWIEKILSEYQKWDSGAFELVIKNPKLFYKLLAKSTEQSVKYIKSLKAVDFDVLAYVFLSVNSEFFIQRLKLIELSNG